MKAKEIAALIEEYAARYNVPAMDILRNQSRKNNYQIPRIKAEIVRELHSKGMKICTISRVFAQGWTTTQGQIESKNRAKPAAQPVTMDETN